MVGAVHNITSHKVRERLCEREKKRHDDENASLLTKGIKCAMENRQRC